MFGDLPATLGLAAFERIENGLFQPIGRLPQWARLPEGPLDLCEHYPILSVFLDDFEKQWTHGSGSLSSDVWTESDGADGEMYLQAVAATDGGRPFLVIKLLPKELYTYQQLAHDFELAKGKVERLSRELEIKRQEAERATQAKSDFLARMSHEIRTPLNSVIGLADVLSATSLTDPQRRCVEISQRNGIALLNLINDILDLSKVEAGKVELENAPFALEDVVAQAMEVVEARVAAKGLWLRQEIAPDVPRGLMGDSGRLRQVLINLLGNSIKFTDKGGLNVRVTRDPQNSSEGRLLFAISDTGIGIAPDKVHSVFESFSQADTSTTRKYGGTGLGLTISRQFVELMGGRIWVESTLGAGSTFLFTAGFGLGDVATGPAKIHTTAADLAGRAQGLRVLLADDSEDNRYLIESYLRPAGITPDCAENGAIAVEKFRAGQYDIVLMDVEMPLMDGFQATGAIREIERQSEAAPTPVLALTAHAFTDMATKATAAGFTGVLTKPIRNVALIEALAHYAPELRTRIVVEEGLEDVVPGYLAKRRAEIPVYRDALESDDFARISAMAHKTKGTGAGYGFPRLTELAGALELAAKEERGEDIRRLTAEISRYLEGIELEYKK